MAARNKTIVKIEHDIEKNREECNWVKVLELADQLSKSWLNSSVAPLCSFLCGEARLELYLQDNPPFITKREGGFEAGDTMLLESKKDLLDASSEAGKKAGVHWTRIYYSASCSILLGIMRRLLATSTRLNYTP
ncbi:tetratricopeptide repeat protein 7B-like [Diaphorina citri]|uniref:Tetratricopeptide repeat protein 7B-like n=1 Tax=Diaphorina citri TaxID=121845 RepID=A0A1S4EF72_DIACI|nr:tetratricopeptide repeat protein 7B-like [Diaphorina citri]